MISRHGADSANWIQVKQSYVQKLMEEVVNHLSGVEGSQVSITLEVNATIPQGTPPPIVKTVTESCGTLRVTDFGFEG